MSVSIRRAVPGDAEAWTDLHLVVWEEAYTGLMPPEVLTGRRSRRDEGVRKRRTMLESGARVLLAEDDGHLVGFASAGPARDEDPPAPVELTAIYARASHHGTGLGRRLLEAALADAGVRPDDAVYLWVLEGNDRAIAFYTRHGFALDGVGEDEPEGRHLRMVRQARPRDGAARNTQEEQA
ncbi:GNAT family N-acetyltransferase [Nocardioides bruguierae]|uniref:GNAT family N-acetyltransferase n=1 Tax=Nocardioides bruguierae TaxID=2945102 RepID=A0A9X2D9Q1_9ACTN|nr:GNAT family N-acetyltransferase [Nocardioides bruguierae]MCM0621740.1 GNAT family N-acetyltransferase [Nocardioides bruguierae]